MLELSGIQSTSSLENLYKQMNNEIIGKKRGNYSKTIARTLLSCTCQAKSLEKYLKTGCKLNNGIEETR